MISRVNCECKEALGMLSGTVLGQMAIGEAHKTLTEAMSALNVFSVT